MKTRETSLAATVASLFGARLVVNTAQRFVYPFLPAIARGLGISLGQAGLLVSGRWLAGMATPATVALVGRNEARRRLAVTGMTLFVAGAAITAAVGVYAGALVGFVLMGLGKPAFDIAAQSHLADRTPYHRRARVLSILELTWAGSLLVGAPVAGWLIERYGWGSPFWLVAAAGAAAIPLLARVVPGAGGGPGTAAGRVRLDRGALALLAVTALFTLAAEVMFVVFGAWLEDGFGLSLVALGGAAFVVGSAELAGEGATLAVADRLGKRRSVAMGLGGSIAGFALLGLDPGTLAVGLTLVAVAFVGFEFTVVSAIPLATEVMPTARARYLAMFAVAMSLGRAAGAALGPWVFDAFGLAGNAVLAAAVDVLALGVLLGWVREREPQSGDIPPEREKTP